jgi:hypothetical protein
MRRQAGNIGEREVEWNHRVTSMAAHGVSTIAFDSIAMCQRVFFATSL